MIEYLRSLHPFIVLVFMFCFQSHISAWKRQFLMVLVALTVISVLSAQSYLQLSQKLLLVWPFNGDALRLKFGLV